MKITKQRIREIIQEELHKLAPVLSENPERAGKRVNDLIAILQKRGFQKAGVQYSSMRNLAEGMVQATLADLGMTLKQLIDYAVGKVLKKKLPEERNAVANALGDGLKKLAREKRKESEKASTPKEKPGRKVVDADITGARVTNSRREGNEVVVTVCKGEVCAEGRARFRGSQSMARTTAKQRAMGNLASKLQGN